MQLHMLPESCWLCGIRADSTCSSACAVTWATQAASKLPCGAPTASCAGPYSFCQLCLSLLAVWHQVELKTVCVQPVGFCSPWCNRKQLWRLTAGRVAKQGPAYAKPASLARHFKSSKVAAACMLSLPPQAPGYG